MTKYYHAPDLARSLRSGSPDPWLAPDLAQSIRAGRAKQWVDPDLAGDLAAASGGGVPNWVPADAKIYIDLIAPGRAWTADDGEVAIDTLLGDGDTATLWDATQYDPALLDSNGYTFVDGKSNTALIGSALSFLLANATLAFKWRAVGDIGENGPSFVAGVKSGDAYLEIDPSTTTMTAESNDALDLEVPRAINSGVSSAINCVALTLTNNRLDMALDGSDAVSSALTTSGDFTDRPASGANQFNAALFAFPIGANLQSITIYDALPSTTGLSALSETGVTNTAPTAISLVWQFPVTEVDATHATVSTLLPGGNQLFNTLEAVDAEGNPPTWTLTDDDGGKFQYQGFVNSVSAVDSLGPGTYHFTLRATDPGGLYVEQGFTITVTA